MSDLLDTSVWVALSVPDHPHHERARHYWRAEASATRAFCRLTWLALPRLLSDRRVLGPGAADGPTAWRVLQQWTGRTEVAVVDEPLGLEQFLGAWAVDLDIRGRHWTDAYLAAFATAGGHRLVSFDHDFARYPGLAWLHLEP